MLYFQDFEQTDESAIAAQRLKEALRRLYSPVFEFLVIGYRMLRKYDLAKFCKPLSFKNEPDGFERNFSGANDWR